MAKVIADKEILENIRESVVKFYRENPDTIPQVKGTRIEKIKAEFDASMYLIKIYIPEQDVVSKYFIDAVQDLYVSYKGTVAMFIDGYTIYANVFKKDIGLFLYDLCLLQLGNVAVENKAYSVSYEVIAPVTKKNSFPGAFSLLANNVIASIIEEAKPTAEEAKPMKKPEIKKKFTIGQILDISLKVSAILAILAMTIKYLFL